MVLPATAGIEIVEFDCCREMQRIYITAVRKRQKAKGSIAAVYVQNVSFTTHASASITAIDNASCLVLLFLFYGAGCYNAADKE